MNRKLTLHIDVHTHKYCSTCQRPQCNIPQPAKGTQPFQKQILQQNLKDISTLSYAHYSNTQTRWKLCQIKFKNYTLRLLWLISAGYSTQHSALPMSHKECWRLLCLSLSSAIISPWNINRLVWASQDNHMYKLKD